jgi:lantibiotic modifying enzyme
MDGRTNESPTLTPQRLAVSVKFFLEMALISGLAGLALGLVQAAHLTGDEAMLAVGDDLLAIGRQAAWGWCWPQPDEEETPPLCGLAHGAAGIAWALAEINALVPQEALQTVIDGALRYERGWFEPARGGWPDLRATIAPRGGPYPLPALWCHGAAGIGLSRLRLYQLQPHPALAAEAAAALQACYSAAMSQIENSSFNFGLTLCHGLGGTIELLLAAHEVLGEDEHLVSARRLIADAVRHLGADVAQWPWGVPGGTWSASLMLGLAGSLLILLRAAYPGRLPSVGLFGVTLHCH